MAMRTAARSFSVLADASRPLRQALAAAAVAAEPSAETVPSLNTLTDSERLMRDAARRFAREIIKPHVAAMDENNKLERGILKGLFEQGYMGIETESEYQGTNASFTACILAIEELAKIDPAVSVICDVQNTLVNTLSRKYGSADLKKTFLPRLATSSVGCFCLSEASSGSDAFAMKASARLDGSHWVLNGTKLWITNSGEADIFLVFANTDFSKGYKGITCFVVEKSMGVQLGKKENKLGIRASSTHPVILEDVRVPKDNVIGAVGQGYKCAIEILNEGRIGIGAQMIGLAQGALDATLPYLFQRKQFGQAIGDMQAVQHQYAQLAVEIEAARLMVYNAARLKEQGQPFVKEAAMAKLYSSQVAERTASKCVEMLGGVGFTKDFPVEKFYRDCKIGAIYEGTSNIQLQTIAKLISTQYK
eukprot:Unigene3462_Nuclearia_a/m.10595 Unigene3462_Nuclearia_a/g.10595  ORF Unigene3462_Nuclearia_a/g.10595 Unigene3462_Nuclearia_a/m.10595 type:complete len:420 (+) Unigene3462_Nuclearia_a:22-1281(+)